MPKTLLTVATRKGTFVLESDDRRDWTLRGPYCEGWPVYHSIYDPNTGSIFAAAASEWHGSAIWRSSDQVLPSSRLSKMPGASTPTSSRSPARASVDTLEILRPSSSP